ncbi:MAG: GNAT family N-acetyltransferase [Gemmatimonadota bacterium]
MDEVVIRRADAADIEPILELVRLSLGEGRIPRSLDYWAWKHEHNPFGRSPILIAEADREIIGLRAFMRWNWSSHGKEIRAVRAVDTATHPGWRGRGIFSRLTQALVQEMREEGIELVFNTPNAFSRPGYLKMGWSSLGRVSLWIRPRRVLRMARSLIERRPQGEDRLEQGTERPADGAVGLRPLSEFIGWSERDFLDRLPRTGGRLSTPLTPEYLRWRYVEIPALEYWAAWSRKAGRRAAIVGRVRSHKGLRELRLCELMVQDTRGSIGQAAGLVRDMVREMRTDYAAGMAAPGTPERQALLRAGFVPAPRLGPVLTVRPLSDDRERCDPLVRSSWRLSIGDLELF